MKNEHLMSVLKAPEAGALGGLLVILIVFLTLSPGFLSVQSVTSMFTLASELGIVAIGVSLLMISGEFDLSVGAVFALSTLIFVRTANAGVNPVIAFLLTLTACALIGLLNGFITIRAGIPSFISTLGAMMFWRGVLLYATGGFPVAYEADKRILFFLGGRIYEMLRATGIWFILLTILFNWILKTTRYGNWVLATGGNREAARAAGVSVDKIKMRNFMLCSLLAGLSGTTNLARYLISQPMLGSGMELEAVAASVIGGNLLTGGYGSIMGTFIGALLMGMIRTGLVSIGVAPYLYTAFTGIILVVSVIVNMTVIKRRVGR